jgi:hypothetical protein
VDIEIYLLYRHLVSHSHWFGFETVKYPGRKTCSHNLRLEWSGLYAEMTFAFSFRFFQLNQKFGRIAKNLPYFSEQIVIFITPQKHHNNEKLRVLQLELSIDTNFSVSRLSIPVRYWGSRLSILSILLILIFDRRFNYFRTENIWSDSKKKEKQFAWLDSKRIP